MSWIGEILKALLEKAIIDLRSCKVIAKCSVLPNF